MDTEKDFAASSNLPSKARPNVEDVALIPLTQNQFALVDRDDLELLSGWKWYAQECSSGFYAYTKLQGVGKRYLMSMAAAIIGNKAGMVIDHINRCTLDNRRCNLRHVTQEQNAANSGFRKLKKDGAMYKGVHRTGRHWRAVCKGKDLGKFQMQEDAAREYDFHAVKLWGKHACINFPEDRAQIELELAKQKNARSRKAAS